MTIQLRKGHYVRTNGMDAETYSKVATAMMDAGFNGRSAYPIRNSRNDKIMINDDGVIDAGPSFVNVSNPNELTVKEVLGEQTFKEGDYVDLGGMSKSDFSKIIRNMEKDGFKRGYPLDNNGIWDVIGIVYGEICTFQRESIRWEHMKRQVSMLAALDKPEEEEQSLEDRVKELESILESTVASHCDLLNFAAKMQAEGGILYFGPSITWSEDIEKVAADAIGKTNLIKNKYRR